MASQIRTRAEIPAQYKWNLAHIFSTQEDWEKAYSELCSNGYYMADMPSSNATIGALLRQHGFYKEAIPDSCPDCYTIKDFCEDHPIGVFVVGTGNHVVGVIDGDYYDSWDSGNEIPVYFWEKRRVVIDDF